MKFYIPFLLSALFLPTLAANAEVSERYECKFSRNIDTEESPIHLRTFILSRGPQEAVKASEEDTITWNLHFRTELNVELVGEDGEVIIRTHIKERENVTIEHPSTNTIVRCEYRAAIPQYNWEKVQEIIKPYEERKNLESFTLGTYRNPKPQRKPLI